MVALPSSGLNQPTFLNIFQKWQKKVSYFSAVWDLPLCLIQMDSTMMGRTGHMATAATTYCLGLLVFT